MRVEGHFPDRLTVCDLDVLPQDIPHELLLQAELHRVDPDPPIWRELVGVVGEPLAVLASVALCVLLRMAPAPWEARCEAIEVPRAGGYAVAAAGAVACGADVLRRLCPIGAVVAGPPRIADASPIGEKRHA